VSNDGDSAATNVQVEDELPTGVTLLDVEEQAGVTCPPAAGTVTCTVANLPAGESRTVTLKVRAPDDAGVIKNKATASAAEDPDSPVSSTEVTTTVAPKLVIVKLDDPDPVRVEGVLLYSLLSRWASPSSVVLPWSGPASGGATGSQISSCGMGTSGWTILY
jgi:hypothetical protein